MTFCLGIFQKYIKTIDEVCAVKWITANSYTQCLPKSNDGRLMYRFIR